MPNRDFCYVILLMFSLSGGECFCEDDVGGDTNATLAVKAEKYHDKVGKYARHCVGWADSHFATNRFGFAQPNKSEFKLTLGLDYDDDGTLKFRPDLRAELDLPYLTDYFDNKVHIVVEQVSDKLHPGESLVQHDDSSLFTGVRGTLYQRINIDIHTDAGVRWRGGPELYVRLKGSREWKIASWKLKLSQKFEESNDKRFSETSSMDWSRKFDPTVLLWSSFDIKWGETQDNGWEFGETLSLVKQLSNCRAIGLQFAILGESKPSEFIDKVRLDFKYRQKLRWEWLYFEITPGFCSSRDYDYQPKPTCTALIDIYFGRAWDALDLF